jgi:hypothetical protein
LGHPDFRDTKSQQPSIDPILNQDSKTAAPALKSPFSRERATNKRSS